MDEIQDVNDEMKAFETSIDNGLDLAYVLRKNACGSEDIFYLKSLNTALDKIIKITEDYKKCVEKQIEEWEERENRKKEVQYRSSGDDIAGAVLAILGIIIVIWICCNFFG